MLCAPRYLETRGIAYVENYVENYVEKVSHNFHITVTQFSHTGCIIYTVVEGKQKPTPQKPWSGKQKSCKNVTENYKNVT